MEKVFKNKKLLIVLFVLIFLATNFFLNTSNNHWKIPIANMQDTGSFQPTLLNNGDVLLISLGSDPAEVFNHQKKSFEYTENKTTSQGTLASTILNNGDILLTGGGLIGAQGFETLDTTEIYNPKTKTFSSAGKMLYPRSEHNATLLKNGKVLITGGLDLKTMKITSSAELYDPSNNIFSISSDMCVPRHGHSSIVLEDGRVLIVGGWTEGSGDGGTVEIYDPNMDSFNCVGKINNSGGSQGLLLLEDGRVFIVGGGAEIYDPKDNSFTKINSSDFPQVEPGVFSIDNDNILILSRYLVSGGPSKIAPAGIYNIKTGEYKSTNYLLDGRLGYTAVQLKDHNIIIAGGWYPKGQNDSEYTYSAYLINTKNLK